MQKNISVDKTAQKKFMDLLISHCYDFNLDPNLFMQECIKDNMNYDSIINHLLEVSGLKKLWLRSGIKNPDFVQEGSQLHFPYILGRRLSSLELKVILENSNCFEHNVYPSDFNLESVVKKQRGLQQSTNINFRGRCLFFVQTKKGICMRSYIYHFDKWVITEEYFDNVQGKWTNGSILFLRQKIEL